jgi:release factor glutamine methyltransferase
VSTRVTIRRALADSGLDAVDAQVLLAHVTGRDRAWLAAHGDDVLEAEHADAFATLAERRRGGEPVAYLTGTREFFGLPFLVTPAVLIPRPETETLVEIALAHLPVDAAARVLDLGTGCGAVALAIAHERPKARVLATDVSAAALAVAAENARRLGLANVAFVRSDWYEHVGVAWPGARFDLIASNPPYVVAGDPHLAEGDLRFEPAVALSPGTDALAAIRSIVAGAREHLAPGGWLALECGYDQAEAVRGLLASAGWSDIITACDLAGIERTVAARPPDRAA